VSYRRVYLAITAKACSDGEEELVDYGCQPCCVHVVSLISFYLLRFIAHFRYKMVLI